MKTPITLGLVLSVLLAGPAHAESMHHRHTEHLLEGYLIGALSWSVGAVTQPAGGVQVGSAYLQPQTGFGLELPINPHACLGLAGIGFELAAGPAVPLGFGLPLDIQLRPGLLLEISGDIPLQLFVRGSVVFRSVRDTQPGVETALMLGWHARPIAMRLGISWETYPEREGSLAGLRLEFLWLGSDPQPE